LRTPTLRDKVLDEQYHERGVVVTPFLTADEVGEIRVAYRSIAPPGDHGLTVDYMRPDRGVMAEVRELMAPVFTRHFPEVFVDHRPTLITFVTKHPGEASDMFLHEDRTFIDERRFRAGTLWIPLVDVGPDIDNGCLFVIPRSHLLARAFSGTGTPELFRPYEGYLRTHLEPLTVPAGSAAFYDTRTLHTSPPNRTDEPREAIACAVVPREARIIHVVGTTRRHRRVHEVNDKFFLDVHPHSIAIDLPPEYPVIEEYEDNSRLLPEDIAAVFGRDGDPPPTIDDPARDGTPDGLLAREPARLGIATTDLPVTAGYLPAVESALVDGIAIESVDGREGLVGAIVVADGRGVTDALPSWADAARPVVRDGERGLIVLVDAGAEARLQLAAEPSISWRLDVIDAALLGATLGIGGHREILDETRSLLLAGGLDATLTNTGPGVLAVLLTSETTVRTLPKVQRIAARAARVWPRARSRR